MNKYILTIIIATVAFTSPVIADEVTVNSQGSTVPDINMTTSNLYRFSYLDKVDKLKNLADQYSVTYMEYTNHIIVPHLNIKNISNSPSQRVDVSIGKISLNYEKPNNSTLYEIDDVTFQTRFMHDRKDLSFTIDRIRVSENNAGLLDIEFTKVINQHGLLDIIDYIVDNIPESKKAIIKDAQGLPIDMQARTQKIKLMIKSVIPNRENYLCKIHVNLNDHGNLNVSVNVLSNKGVLIIGISTGLQGVEMNGLSSLLNAKDQTMTLNDYNKVTSSFLIKSMFQAVWTGMVLTLNLEDYMNDIDFSNMIFSSDIDQQLIAKHGHAVKKYQGNNVSIMSIITNIMKNGVVLPKS